MERKIALPESSRDKGYVLGMGETSMRKIMLTAACAALLATPAVALAAPIAGPLPIAKVSGEIITVNKPSETHKGRHIRTKHSMRGKLPWLTPGVDSYSSYPSGGTSGPGFVAPGDPGTGPYLNSDFDRAVQATQYNGR
jgi:hypothetical protein